MEEKFNHFVKPSATEFTRIAEARNGRKIQPFRQAERNRVYSNCRGEKWKNKVQSQRQVF